jgi:hydrogenase maturation protein HypF
VFQNRLLTELTKVELERRGLLVLVPRLLPPNDGGISYGQAAIAAAAME